MATPPTAVTVVGPDSVPPAGFVPSASVTAPTNDVAVLPLASRAVTTIDGESVLPAVPLDGCVVKTSVAGAAALTLKGVLVAPVRPLLEASNVTPVPAALSVRSTNRATPLTAVTVVLPPSVPPAGPLPSAMVTDPVKPVEVLPKLSWASIATAGEIVAPAFTAEGCVVNARALAAAGATVNALLAAPPNPVLVAVSV